MYDTIRFNQGFIIFNHYNLSVGLCLCVRASVCVRVSVCLCVRLRLYVWVYLQVSAFMCVRVRPRSHIQYFLFRFTALMFRNHWLCSFFVPTFQDITISPPPSLCYLVWYSFLHKPSAFLFWISAIQSKCCIPDFKSRSADRLCEFYIESPFIIWSLTGSTKRFNKNFNENKHKKNLIRGSAHLCFFRL